MNGGDLSLLGAVAAMLVVVVLAGRELAAASGHAPPRIWSLILAVALVPLVLLVGWAAAPRVAPLFDAGRAAPRISAPSAAADAGQVPQVTEAFDLVPVGDRPATAWSFTPESAAEVVPHPNAVNRSLRLTVAEPGSRVVVCRSFDPVTRSTAGLRADLWLEASTTSGRVSVAAVASESTVADVVLLGGGGAEYADGGSRETTADVFGLRPGRSYAVTMAVHVTAGRYDWSMRPAARSLPRLGADGVELGDQAPRSVDRFCIGVEWDTAATRLLIDDVSTPE